MQNMSIHLLYIFQCIVYSVYTVHVHVYYICGRPRGTAK